MSQTASDFFEDVLSDIPPETLRALATSAENASAMAFFIVDAVVHQLDSSTADVAVLETVKFKRMITELPEGLWPKPDIQKEGDE